MLYVFGDSHAAFCFDRVPEAQIHWLGPRTMHRFSLEADSVLPTRVATAAPGDVFVFVFGEIDIRCHILNIAERNGTQVSAVVEELVGRYVSSVALAMPRYKGCRAVLMQPPFPSDRRPNPEFPFVGTLDQRVEAHQILSSQMRSEAAKRGLLYLEIPKKYSTSGGGLRRMYSDDGVHIMPVEAGFLISSMGELIGRRVIFERSWLDVWARRANLVTGKKLSRRGGMLRKYSWS